MDEKHYQDPKIDSNIEHETEEPTDGEDEEERVGSTMGLGQSSSYRIVGLITLSRIG